MGTFDPSKESWLNYTERIEDYFLLKTTAEGLKNATLINFIEPEPYAILKDVFAPDIPNTKPYKDLVTARASESNCKLHLQITKRGAVRVECRFAQALVNPNTCPLQFKHNNMILIDKERNISIHYLV